jgi:hypothetical protein
MSPFSSSNTAFVEVAVNSDKSANGTVLGKHRGRELLRPIGVLEDIEIPGLLNQTFPAGLGLFFLAAVVNVVDQLLVTAVAANAIVFTPAKLNCT